MLVVDINMPRNLWPLGRITDVIYDNEKLVRSAKIKISRCKNDLLRGFETTIIHRPISKLILLRCVEEM